jgi:phosphatidylglycerophosphate synthase
VPNVRTGPVKGLLAQIALLMGLAATVGLGAAGWTVGALYAVITSVLLTRGLRLAGTHTMGPADRVTYGRAVLVGGVVALVADSFGRETPVAVLVVLTGVALALDWVDGQVARRTGTSSPLGARFDMEVDAFLLLVLSVYLVRPVGGWVLGIGLMRYAFVAASWVLPWMRWTPPQRYWAKVAAAAQGVALLVAASGVLPHGVAVLVVAGSLGLLIESFGTHVVRQWQMRTLVVPAEFTRDPALRDVVPTGAAR